MYKIVHIFVYHSIKVPVSVQFCTDFGVIFGAHAHVLQKCYSATPQMWLRPARQKHVLAKAAQLGLQIYRRCTLTSCACSQPSARYRGKASCQVLQQHVMRHRCHSWTGSAHPLLNADRADRQST